MSDVAAWSPPDEDATVVGVLRAAVEKAPDQPFVDFHGTVVSYGDVWTRAQSLARGLHSLGVRPGDTVVTMLDNHDDSLAAWYAANLLGAIWVGINTALRGEFLRHVLLDSGARVAICEAEFVERITLLLEGPIGIDLLLVRGDQVATSVGSLAIEPLDAARLGDGPEAWHEGAASDISLLVYTGGTTGPSKGCANSSGYVLNLARRYLEQTARQADELNWSALPMYHFNVTAQTITSTTILGGTAAVAPRFSVSGFWPEVERTGARVVNLLGSMGALIAQMPDTDAMLRCHGQIRFVHGAPFPPEVATVWHDRFGVPEVGGGVYGLTEAVPLTTLRSGTKAPLGTSGRRNDADFDVRIFDDRDREVGPGEVGEVVARPKRPNVMFQGYWRRPDATVEVTRNLWFHTGDLGSFDEDGFFRFADRKKDYLRRRGENISSVEMEATYLVHPEIEQVAVHAVPSELTEDDVKVTAVLIAGSCLSPTDLFEWSKERMPYFALPRYIEFRDALPVSAVGRVHKYQLRDEGCTPATWDREREDVTWERR